MGKHVYFIRHGESEENVSRVHIGSGAELTETGKEQAVIIAERMSRIGVDALISSPFNRARDTAAPIAFKTGVAMESNELFGEWLEPSKLIGLHREHPERAGVLDAISSAVDDHHFRHSDEETFAEFLARAHAALRVLEEHPGKRICVVTHGGFLRALVGVMLFGPEFSKKDFVRLRRNLLTTNTGVTYAYYDDGGWRVITWNDQSHLG